MLIAFEGHSDDTFGWETVGSSGAGDDYDNSANGKPIVWRIQRGEQGLFVWGLYSPRDAPRSTPGCWVIGIQQLDEGIPLPHWSITWSTASCTSHPSTGQYGYSPVLIVDAPDDATIELVTP